MTIATLGIDLGKTICSIAGMDAKGHIVVRKRLRRHRVIEFAADLPRCVVAMEACCGAHHIGRRLLELGHDPSVVGVAELYAPIASTLVIDTVDARHAEAVEAAGMRCVVTDTVMSTAAVARQLAIDALASVPAASR